MMRNGRQSGKQGTLKFSRSLAACVVALGLLAGLIVAPSFEAEASNPGSGTLAPSSAQPLTWQGSAIGGVADGEGTCIAGVNCDSFQLTLTGTPADWAGKVARVKASWLLPASDYDVFIHKDTVTGPEVGNSAQGLTTEESVAIDPAVSGTGVFVVNVVYFAAVAADQYSGSATVEAKQAPAPTPTPGPQQEPPRFFNYSPPSGVGASAGEPTLGVNWATGKVMYIAALETLQVTFDDSSSPARATWQEKSAPNTTLTTLDPILFTDGDSGPSRTNRTFASQLLGKLSAMSFTDDDGETWTPSQGSGINSGVDHQTVGGGPYAANPDGTLKGGAIRRPGLDLKIYPNAVYYASQDIGLAQIARSDDGGLTFGPAIPMYNLTQCGGLHGHIKVAQDGTVYVPNKSCGGKQAVAVSEDNGLTWSVRPIPDSQPGANDPSVGIATDGTIYVGYSNSDGAARVAVSRDRGLTWSQSVDVGAPLGVKNSVFPAAVAGDPDRAAYFFLGTSEPGTAGIGTDQTAPYFDGAWYGYIATTYDGGKSWVTVNATPNDPVQRGVVCTNGTTCPTGTRNLLDFNDAVIDKRGRVLAAYADGCITAQCIEGVDRDADGRLTRFDNDGTDRATIIRQAGGKTLFAAFDPPVVGAPAAPGVIAAQDTNRVNLTWTTPDNGGSPITGYNVYRGAAGGAGALIATVGPNVNSYSDNTNGGGLQYQVSATNANGEGPRSKPASPAVLESACGVPGITALTDPAETTPSAAVDIRSLSIAEPYAGGANQLVFTLKVGAGAVPRNSSWYIIWQRPTPDASHDRNYIAMRSDLFGSLKFEHGRISYPLAYTAPAANQGNIPTKFGDLQGSYDAATGTITVTAPSDRIDNPVAGQSLVSLEVRTFFARNDSLPVNQNLSIDFAAGGNYQLVGNESCRQPLAAPSNLTVIAKQATEMGLRWTDNSADEDSFLIERTTTLRGTFEQIATVGAGVTTYTDRLTNTNVTYFYRVRAARGSERSGYTNTAGSLSQSGTE